MKISATIRHNECVDYFFWGEYFLCGEFVQSVLGETPERVKVTVSDYRMHRCRKFKFTDRAYAHVNESHPADKNNENGNGHSYVYRQARKWIKQSFPDYVGQTLYFHIEKA